MPVVTMTVDGLNFSDGKAVMANEPSIGPVAA